ncbi:MAG: polysaccharide biosynthesis/export family protein [Methylocystis sp.]
MQKTAFLCLLGVFALGGCITPSSGPQRQAIIENSSRQAAPDGVGSVMVRPSYELVEYDESLLGLLSAHRYDSLLGRFGNHRGGPGPVRVGVGDVISLSLYEASASGLFSPTSSDSLRQGSFVALPQQTVDVDGSISVPYAGRVPVKGKSTKQIELEIISRLKDRTEQPQVVASVLESRSSLYSVQGEANHPGRFAINWAGERLFEGISRAGGAKWPDYETSVTLTRRGKTAATMLQTVVMNPSEDIYLQPGDEIFLRREPRFFTALGATGRSGHYPIDTPRLTLAEGIGRAQGLLDIQADPTGVFLLRWERPELLAKMGRDVQYYSTARIPTIYHFDLENPSHLLASQRIEIADKDVVYVTNATTVEMHKALRIFADLSYITLNAAETAWFVSNGSGAVVGGTSSLLGR